MKHGAHVNATDLWQFTPLHEAASKMRLEVCSLLLCHGADPTLLNCHSKTAMDAAPTRELQHRLACEWHGRGRATWDTSGTTWRGIGKMLWGGELCG